MLSEITQCRSSSPLDLVSSSRISPHVAQAISTEPIGEQLFQILRLPGEIRNLIYEYCLAGENVEPNGNGRAFEVPAAALLRTCRQVYREAKDCLYRKKAFKFEVHHSMRCWREEGTCRRGDCTSRCIKASWDANLQDRPKGIMPRKGLLPIWTHKIEAAHIVLHVDPIKPLKVSRGNLLAALNSFLHIFAREATSVENVQVEFVFSFWAPLYCLHLFACLYPLVRCRNLKRIELKNVPDGPHLQEKLQRCLDRTTPCRHFDRLVELVDAAQILLWQAETAGVRTKDLERLTSLVKKPEYQFRSKCDIGWYTKRSALIFQVPKQMPEEPHATIGTQLGMKSMCKGKKFYRRLERADMSKLEQEMHYLHNALLPMAIEKYDLSRLRPYPEHGKNWPQVARKDWSAGWYREQSSLASLPKQCSTLGKPARKD